MKKMENQEINHKKQMGVLNQQYAAQIEELTELVARMSNAMIESQKEYANKWF